MANTRKTVHVVSNSHWDREWCYPFEETRLLLLDFMDGLLDLLDTDPDFHSFTMDSQTMCVADYLEWRPEKRATVEKHVRSGRLIIGPWYSLPEEYIVNGESLVRNLVVGHRIAASLGKVCKMGYTPFSYGQTSQMPQIYNGFGIDTIIFYRGINTPHSEFILEGPDGSRLLGMRFGCMSRFSYYIYVYRVLRYGSDDVFARYDWDRGSAPMRLASERYPREHYYVLDSEKKQWNDAPIREQLLKLVRDESEHFTTSHICCMQGFDSSNPDPMESEIIKLCRKLLPEHDIKLSNLEDYMNAMRKEVKNPTVLTGESRNPGSVGKWTHLCGDVISARIRLKQGNNRAETAVQRKAEPWSAIGSMVGGEYLKTALDHAWKYILDNHPHDTITGAGIDQMEKDSLFRYDQAAIIGDSLARRGMQAVQIQIDNSDLSPKDSVLTVFNPCPFPWGGVVSCYIDMPDGMGYEAFSIRTPDGKEIKRVQLKEQSEPGILVRNLQDISIELRAKRVLCHIEVDAIPAYGYKTYHIVREDRFGYFPGTLAPETNVLENEHLRVAFNSDGTFDLTHKSSRHTFHNLHYIEDSGETGHSWVHMEPDDNRIITSHGAPVFIALEEAGPLVARMRVSYHMRVPVGILDEMTGDFREAEMNHTRRRDEYREIVVKSRFTLRAGAKRLDVETELENTCRNHRMRVVFPTRLAADTTESEAGFDVISRDIHVKKTSPYYGRPNPQYPMHRFVDLHDKKMGFAILNNCGMREYEVADTKDRPLAITLFRAFTYRNCPIFGRYEVYPEMELAQCPGRMQWSYSIYPHTGDWTNGVFEQAEQLNLPLEPAQCGPHKGKLPKSMSFFALEGAGLQLAAFKRHEDRPDSFTVRIFNPSGKTINGALRLFKPFKKAWLTNLNEERESPLKPEGATIKLRVPKKKIVTIEFTL
ncbi:MAG TPA: glycoside hydrolase family 38 C-terminal domain-containing protein [Candidatus Hydrogenedentes bacterium]|nr:glycoside hydrolase family 38 C-terminal domain-containing protein [Candidatus Hydrogenedentota bacterium]HRT21442.1 glycoside hydrolase family 38 C-terminal domain-containing protein [Candidatus Hydrogenedentota bacterium]HRT63954.1 glycoside hydrolase family 38 C-terminal domain-containing protein [Candidatus Hydrogenedentota bacterium]